VAQKSLSKGLLAQSEGRWDKAEKALLAQAHTSDQPMLNYLAAAKVANQQGASERVRRYIKMAHEAAPKKDIAVDLTEAELQVENGNYDAALEILKRLDFYRTKNPRILALLAETYRKQKDWNKLADLLEDVRRKNALDLDTFLLFERQTYVGLLKNAFLSKDTNRIRHVWTRIPKHLQNDGALIEVYAEGLIGQGEGSMTETLLRKSIETKWNPNLVDLYGQITEVNSVRQLEYAERWLAHHQNDAVLLLTLGRISMKLQLWGKARSYLEASINLSPTAESYYLLAKLLEKIGEEQEATQYYKSGLCLVASKPGHSMI